MNSKNPVIGIVGGKGRMGQLFAEFFCERGIEVLISDLGTKLTNKELVQKSDVTIVSVPIDKTKKIISEILPYLKKGNAITDFTSVKELAVNAMSKAKSGVEIFGMHPMFGNSNPIPGQTIILCPTKRSGLWFKWMQKFLSENGAALKIMTARDHDKMMAIAQDLIHFVEITCADGLRKTGIEINKLLGFVSKASELKVMSSSRILDQDPGLYGSMQIENSYNLKFLNQYKKTVDDLIEIIKKKDAAAFKKYFETTKKYLGNYAHEAYKDSSFLIDKLIENRNKTKAQKISKKQIPSRRDLALLGPKNTYSDIAADKYMTSNPAVSKKYFTKDIEEVFELVEQGKVAQGIVPIENKLDGTIRESLDQLFSRRIHIINSINLPIHHCLIVLPHVKASDIKTVISHQQGLNQCKNYLKKDFPSVQKEAFSSTAKALEKLVFSNNKNLAVIASKQAAQANNLKILAENIEDDSTNSTKFFVIEKGDYKPNKAKKANHASIAFYFDEDSPGSLFAVFKDFAEAKINLTKIESRPTRKEFGDYIFYLDFEGSLNDEKVKSVLSTISKKVAHLKILGDYYL